MTRWGGVVCLGLLGACGHTAPPGAESPAMLALATGPGPWLGRAERGNVALDVLPADAEVFVDGVLQGIADDFDGVPRYLEVAPGVRRVEFRKPGMKPWATVLVVGAEGRQRIVARLSP